MVDYMQQRIARRSIALGNVGEVIQQVVEVVELTPRQHNDPPVSTWQVCGFGLGSGGGA